MNIIKCLTRIDMWITVSLITTAIVTELSTLIFHIDHADSEELQARQSSRYSAPSSARIC
jgi:hypothetical protein